MGDPDYKIKRSKRREDWRRKNLRDSLRKIKEDTKTHNKKKNNYEDNDGEVS